MIINIDANARLELTAERHARPLFDAVNNNREHLSVFLPWVNNMQSVDDFRDYIRNCELLYEEEKEVSFVIILNEVLVGRIGLHYLNLQNKHAAIGYWLTEDAQGKGIISRSCKKLLTFGFENMGLHRIEIKVATDNLRSQAIPEKLNFKKEGILRQTELVNNKFLDLFIYSMLCFEWAESTTND